MPNYPYISGPGGVVAVIAQLRKTFPATVDAAYLQRHNIAPSNESYVISILKFLGMIDDDGKRVEDRTDYFYGSDDAFQAGLDAAIRDAYAQLFDEMGEGAWDTEKEALTHWFRVADKSSEIVGQRQASTFQLLSAFAGHGEVPSVKAAIGKKAAASPNVPAKKATAKKAAAAKPTETPGGVGGKTTNGQDVGLTVRIEVNLPPGGDADTYDAIFASIKKHLMS